MWGVVYHQTMRKVKAFMYPTFEYALTVLYSLFRGWRAEALAFGFRNSSIGSQHSQLYLLFLVRCVDHQFQMFNGMRRDRGEFVFFMSQPIAITTEDFVRWLWLQSRSGNRDQKQLPTLIGYLTVFLWFSVHLPRYVKGCRNVGVVRDIFLGTKPFDVGGRFACSIFGILHDLHVFPQSRVRLRRNDLFWWAKAPSSEDLFRITNLLNIYLKPSALQPMA